MEEAPRRNIKDQTATDYWLEKGDYINFDYLTIGWDVPLGKSRKYIQSLRLALTVNNPGYHHRVFRTVAHDQQFHCKFHIRSR